MDGKDDDGIFFVDFWRRIKPLVSELSKKEEIQIDNLTIDRLFSYMFVAEDVFLSNLDYTQFTLRDLDGYHRWSWFKKEKFAGYEIDPETLVLQPIDDKTPKLKFSDIKALFLSKEWTKE